MNPCSAKTSLNQVSALHKWMLAKDNKIPVFDFGAGKKGKVDDAFYEACTPYFPYDPFCRSSRENSDSLDANIDKETGHVLCSNVLNVLEDNVLPIVINSLFLKTSRTWLKSAYISVYHKKSLPKNRKVGNHFQRNEPIEWYIPHLQKRFSSVEKVGKFLVCKV